MMFEEVVLRIVLWLILSAGVLTIVAGCLYASFWMVGKILKLLGFWNDFMRITAMYYGEKRRKKSKKEASRR